MKENMKTTRIFLGLVMLCGTAFGTPAPIITTTPTNGPTTITVHARTKDGKVPVGVSCVVVQPQGQQLFFPMPQPLPLVGSSGDWTATNVPPGNYEVVLRGTNYAEDRNSIIQFFDFKTNTHYSIVFVLSRGATFKGRVLDDATGKPIEGAYIYASASRSYDAHTDQEGRYAFFHIADEFYIDASTTNHVMRRISLRAQDEDSTISVPDIRLRHGGWISGRVKRPAEVESNASAMVALAIQGSLPKNSLIEEAFTRKDDTFRTHPLPPGTYTLDAEWHYLGKGDPRQTWQAKGSVSNIVVIAGRETTNVFIPTKLTIQTNSTGGR